MRDSHSFSEIFLHKKPVDMRKSINGLSLIVSEHMQQNPCDGGLFVFVGRTSMIMKCIYWDRSGFALWQKRLEKERFKWPKKLNDEVIKITAEQMQWLLHGLDIIKAKPHEELRFDSFS